MTLREYLLANDAISGKEGKVIMSMNGRSLNCAEIKSLIAKIDKTKKEFKALGYRGTQHKATGWTGTGTVSFYYVTSVWSSMMINYAKTGIDTYFDMVVINSDPASAAGAQYIQLMRCNLDGVEVAKLDVEADWLDATFNFTFEGIDLTAPFNMLQQDYKTP